MALPVIHAASKKHWSKVYQLTKRGHQTENKVHFTVVASDSEESIYAVYPSDSKLFCSFLRAMKHDGKMVELQCQLDSATSVHKVSQIWNFRSWRMPPAPFSVDPLVSSWV